MVMGLYTVIFSKLESNQSHTLFLLSFGFFMFNLVGFHVRSLYSVTPHSKTILQKHEDPS